MRSTHRGCRAPRGAHHPTIVSTHAIDDWRDPRLDHYRNLRDAELLQAEGRFVAEGTETVRMLLQSDFAIESVVLKPSLVDKLHPDLARRPDVPVLTAEPRILSQVVGYEIHRGALACGRRPLDRDRAWLLARIDTVEPCRLLVLDAVHDPWNVGGAVRSARGLGLDALVLGPGCADPWYRRAIRASVGHAFHQPIVCDAHLPSLLASLEEHGVACHAGLLSDDSRPLADLRPGRRWAVVVGNEDRAVSPAVAARCRAVHIPMAPGVDSLNAGVSAALLVHGLMLLEEPP